MESVINIRSFLENSTDSFESFIYLMYEEKTMVFNSYEFHVYSHSGLDFGENDIHAILLSKYPHIKEFEEDAFVFDVNKDLIGFDETITLSEQQIMEIKKVIYA